MYHNHIVFFGTPQTFQSDIDNGNLDVRDVVCLVIDEAHKATGAYAYATVVESILKIYKRFIISGFFNNSESHCRIVGLSATPGNNIESIQSVITSLCIQRLETKTDEDYDIAPHIHDRNVEIIKVKNESNEYITIKYYFSYLFLDNFQKAFF